MKLLPDCGFSARFGSAADSAADRGAGAMPESLEYGNGAQAEEK
ncbi:MAG TPA: hypothetical protein VJ770_29555 [Stellaceae bacterium]|nr:hypothetical protein [Stellaceae bacterium]